MASLVEYFPNDGDLEAYVRHLADLMGLKDWKIILDDEKPDEDTDGQCRVTYGRRIAHIRLAEYDTIEGLRWTIVHELLHCHMDCLTLPVTNVRNVLGQPLYDATSSALDDYIEQVTDAIAKCWAESLPLPDPAREQEAA